MSEFAEICVKHCMIYIQTPSPKDRRDIIKYLLTSKEWAIFRIKEMPFF